MIIHRFHGRAPARDKDVVIQKLLIRGGLAQRKEIEVRLAMHFFYDWAPTLSKQTKPVKYRDNMMYRRLIADTGHTEQERVVLRQATKVVHDMRINGELLDVAVYDLNGDGVSVGFVMLPSSRFNPTRSELEPFEYMFREKEANFEPRLKTQRMRTIAFSAVSSVCTALAVAAYYTLR